MDIISHPDKNIFYQTMDTTLVSTKDNAIVVDSSITCDEAVTRAIDAQRHVFVKYKDKEAVEFYFVHLHGQKGERGVI